MFNLLIFAEAAREFHACDEYFYWWNADDWAFEGNEFVYLIGLNVLNLEELVELVNGDFKRLLRVAFFQVVLY